MRTHTHTYTPPPCPHVPTMSLCLQVQELIINKDPMLLDSFLDVSGDGSGAGQGGLGQIQRGVGWIRGGGWDGSLWWASSRRPGNGGLSTHFLGGVLSTHSQALGTDVPHPSFW